MNPGHIGNLVQNVRQACDPCNSCNLTIVGVEDGVSVLRESHNLVIRSRHSLYERGIVPDLFHVLIWKGVPCIIANWSNGVMLAFWESQHDAAMFLISFSLNHITTILQDYVLFVCMWLCSHCSSQTGCKHPRVWYQAACYGELGKEYGKGLGELLQSCLPFSLITFNFLRVITIAVMECFEGLPLHPYKDALFAYVIVAVHLLSFTLYSCL